VAAAALPDVAEGEGGKAVVWKRRRWFLPFTHIHYNACVAEYILLYGDASL
jgi:hypothetical protein